MPHLLHTHSRTTVITEAVSQLILRDGLAGPSLRSIAAESRISTGSLLHHLTDRQRLIGVTGGHFLTVWSDAVARRVAYVGWAGFLPGDHRLATTDADADADEVDQIRVWLAWRELARGSDLAEKLDELDRREQELVLRHVPGGDVAAPAEEALRERDLAYVVLLGLRDRLATGPQPLTLTAAQSLWASLDPAAGTASRSGREAPRPATVRDAG